MSLTNELLSGIEFGQNVATVTSALGISPIYQTFYLPTDIERGARAGEIRIPELSGLSVLLDVAAGTQETVSVDWALEREIFGSGWNPVVNGTTVGAQAEGDKVWFDIYFDDLVTIDPAALTDQFRFSLIGTTDTSVWRASVASTLAYRILTASGDKGVDFLGNSYRNVVFKHSVGNVSADATNDSYWFSKPNPSRFAIENLFFDVQEAGNASVIDSVLVDPITPDVYFHIYYTDEGDPGTTAAEWNEKLWTRVPKTFQAKTRETHVLPSPISARYMKIEFSHLQAKPYSPGNFQRPIRYQKHPKWVLDYFLARQAEQDSISDRFVSSRTEVRYSALDLAYNYYLDDLMQEPDQPAKLNTNQVDALKEFFQSRSDISDQIDNSMAQKISTILAPYAQGLPGLLGESGAQVLELPFTNDPISTVSSLNRDAIVFEQSYPVMFFYLTARHRYREVSASLTHDRAYFVGVRQVAFLRERYTKSTDTNLYVEIGGDSVNLTMSDFVRDNNSLVISDG